MEEKANDRQVAGDHYKVGGEEHWDRVHRLGLDYFQSQITKYVERCWKKNGIQDLKKAQHFLQKYIELQEVAEKEKAEKVNPVPDIWATPLYPKDPRNESPWATPLYPKDNTSEKHNPRSDEYFTYEGGGMDHELYTCKRCKAHFRTPIYGDPHAYHYHQPNGSGVGLATGEGEPTKNYTNQD